MSEILEKLTIQFINTKPVEVMDFLTSIHGFRKEYEATVKTEGFKFNDNDMKLYIKVKEGSMIWEFIRQATEKPLQASLAFVGNKILNKTWAKLSEVFEKIKKEESVSDVPIETLNNAKEFLQPASNDLASRVKVLYEDKDRKLEYEKTFNGTDGKAIYSKIEEIITYKKVPLKDEFEDKILQLSISNRQNSTAIRGVIADFDEDNYYQIALSDNIKDEIKKQAKPFEGYYLVSGSIKRSQNKKIVLYYITKIEKIETDESYN